MNIGETIFYEKINIKKLNYILNNHSKYEAIITEQEKEMRRTDKMYNDVILFQQAASKGQPVHNRHSCNLPTWWAPVGGYRDQGPPCLVRQRFSYITI